MSGKIAGRNKTRKAGIPLTKKQRALVAAKLSNPDATMVEAGRKAGYEGSDAAVKVSASRALKSANVRERFLAAMEGRKKLSDEALLEKLEEGLDAKVTKLFAHEGRIVDSEEMIDFPTRGSYLTLAAKLKGLEVNKTEVFGPNGSPLLPEVSPAVKELTKADLLALIAAMDAKEAPVVETAKPLDGNSSAGAETGA